MAGANFWDGNGMEVKTKQVPTIGGTDGIPAMNPIVETAHIDDGGPQAVSSYPENPGVMLDDRPYPKGTVFPEGAINDAPGIH